MVYEELEQLCDRGRHRFSFHKSIVRLASGRVAYGSTFGPLAYLKRNNLYRMYHIPSGLNVATTNLGFAYTSSVKRCIMMLIPIANWDTKKLASIRSKELLILLIRDYCLERPLAESAQVYLRRKAKEYGS